MRRNDLTELQFMDNVKCEETSDYKVNLDKMYH